MNTVRLILGDSLVKLKDLETGSIDAVISDPPYELTTNKKGGSGLASLNLESPHGRSRIGTGNGGGFMGMKWDATGIAFSPELWGECFRILKPNGVIKAFSGTRTYHRMAKAMREVGFVDFEVHAWTYGSGFPKSMDVSKQLDKQAGVGREVIGSVKLPKFDKYRGHGRDEDGVVIHVGMSRKLGEFDHELTAPATDAARQWSGYGTALKPAWEPIVVARKPQ
jgi:site-specific DNA-methyltransferase (adenine-specific)